MSYKSFGFAILQAVQLSIKLVMTAWVVFMVYWFGLLGLFIFSRDKRFVKAESHKPLAVDLA